MFYIKVNGYLFQAWCFDFKGSIVWLYWVGDIKFGFIFFQVQVIWCSDYYIFICYIGYSYGQRVVCVQI